MAHLRRSTTPTAPPSGEFESGEIPVGTFFRTNRGEDVATRGRLSTTPPSFTELEDSFVMPERVFFDRLEERARRAELLTALLQIKGLTPEQGVRALQAALGAVVASAEEACLPSLSSLGRALQAAIGELGIGAGPARVVDVLVLDEAEISCDLVALAVEAQGHIVRCARTYDDFVRQLDERLPDLIITEVELSNAPARHFCSTLLELLSTRRVPVVAYSGLPKAQLQRLAYSCGACAAISKEDGISSLLAALDSLLRT